MTGDGLRQNHPLRGHVDTTTFFCPARPSFYGVIVNQDLDTEEQLRRLYGHIRRLIKTTDEIREELEKFRAETLRLYAELTNAVGGLEMWRDELEGSN